LSGSIGRAPDAPEMEGCMRHRCRAANGTCTA
jgi:hypothetical protein